MARLDAIIAIRKTWPATTVLKGTAGERLNEALALGDVRYPTVVFNSYVVGYFSEADQSAYFHEMSRVIGEIERILRPKRYMALYVSDSWRKRAPGDPGSGTGVFVPIGFELFAILRERFKPVDIIAVARHNAKLTQGNRSKAAEAGNYFDRGFNYLFIMKSEPIGGAA